MYKASKKRHRALLLGGLLISGVQAEPKQFPLKTWSRVQVAVLAAAVGASCTRLPSATLQLGYGVVIGADVLGSLMLYTALNNGFSRDALMTSGTDNSDMTADLYRVHRNIALQIT